MKNRLYDCLYSLAMDMPNSESGDVVIGNLSIYGEVLEDCEQITVEIKGTGNGFKCWQDFGDLEAGYLDFRALNSDIGEYPEITLEHAVNMVEKAMRTECLKYFENFPELPYAGAVTLITANAKLKGETK